MNQCRDCLVSDGLNDIPEEMRTQCETCISDAQYEDAYQLVYEKMLSGEELYDRVTRLEKENAVLREGITAYSQALSHSNREIRRLKKFIKNVTDAGLVD